MTRDDSHDGCREVERKLREANRRLQAEGPALERDKLILELSAEIADRQLKFRLAEASAAATLRELRDIEAVLREAMPASALLGDALARAVVSGLERAHDEIARLEAETVRLREACAKQNAEICQTLGKALGYPWFKDDRKNFPDATEEHGVCVGDHVAESIAMEAARRIATQDAEIEKLRAQVRELEARLETQRE